MDLTTNYMGIALKNPIVPSASPLSEKLDNIRQMEDMGAAAVVMYSLFEEQISHESQQLDHYLSYGSESFGEALSYFPDLDNFKVGPDEYVKLISMAKQAVDIPIIGSLNGVSTGGWIEYAKKIEDAGADALELNVYYIPTNLHMTGNEVEQMYIDIIRDVKKNITIPIGVKLSPYFSSMANMAYRLAEAGSNALVLFNRFYQPDFDLDELEVVPELVLSKTHELRLPLRWVAILYGRVPVDFGITSGIRDHIGVIKSMMAGAKVAMMTSELLENGMGRVREILNDMTAWMEENEYESIEQMQGSMSQMHVAEPAAFERANYMKMLASWKQDPTARFVG